LFRPPSGLTNPTIARVADRLDLTIVGWSKGIEDGAIVRLLDASSVAKTMAVIASKNLRVTSLSKWAA
jgi:hypothetical protein